MDVPSARVEEWFWRRFKLTEPTFVAGAPYYSPRPSAWRAKLGRAFDRHPWRTSVLYTAPVLAYQCFLSFSFWSARIAVPVCIALGVLSVFMFRFVTGPRYYSRLAAREHQVSGAEGASVAAPAEENVGRD